MDSETLYCIGELSRRSGLPVKTIRFYSDLGIVPPAGRTPAGYRLYGPDALARLDLARTLRDLGLDLATVGKVLDREASLPEVVAAHAEALDAQIRTLRLRRAVLRAITGQERDLVHRLTTLTRSEHHRLVTDFAFDGLRTNPEVAALLRSVLPELPDDPAPEQVDAWVELAELCRSAEFRTAVRRTADAQAEELARCDAGTFQDAIDRAVRERLDEAVAAGLLPACATGPSPAATVADLYAHAFERAGESDLRRWLLARLRAGGEPLVERYWLLLATVNGWPASATLAPVHPWFTELAA
ncbi:helix-turn-helix domain-containing protein [Streptomyces goshikiensis]|uniref:helix-turn-helix domain-containing protein n=1 Tax=Streptomyces goshikiensis TaxID=1942 RepID=UPI003689C6C0